MQISVELSLYPMNDDPIPEITRFIGDLQAAGLTMTVNQMSTQLTGELGAVLAALQRAMERSFAAADGRVVVAKFLNKALPVQEPPDLPPVV
jgi:uncharacterized protein YqgV (UPF0045/DUF77 family)